MAVFKFDNVYIEGFGMNLPEREVTSAEIEDQLAPIYEKLNIPFGTLERLSGVGKRRVWDDDVLPSYGATLAVKELLDTTGFDKSRVGALFNCSVSRDYFEPATACLVHHRLGFRENCFVMDISNACIGFSNGILTMANLIEHGSIEAGIVVSGETVSRPIRAVLAEMQNGTDLTREMFLKLLPTFTLGSGAVAWLLCNSKLATHKHKIKGAVSRSASQFSDLCVGNSDFVAGQELAECNPVMMTDSAKLISSAAKVGAVAWKDFSEFMGWTKDDVDHIFCHQVGRQVNEAFYDTMGLDYHKEYTVYKELGNLVSAALPTAVVMGTKAKPVESGSKVLLTGFGSGLNAIFTGIHW